MTRSTYGRPITCHTCHQTRPHYGLNQCASCYHATYAPATGTGRGGRGVPKTGAVLAARLEDLEELRAQGEDLRMIAQRIGVSVRTVHRYRARLRETT